MTSHELLKRWRMILGKEIDSMSSIELNQEELKIDDLLDLVYFDNTRDIEEYNLENRYIEYEEDDEFNVNDIAEDNVNLEAEDLINSDELDSEASESKSDEQNALDTKDNSETDELNNSVDQDSAASDGKSDNALKSNPKSIGNEDKLIKNDKNLINAQSQDNYQKQSAQIYQKGSSKSGKAKPNFSKWMKDLRAYFQEEKFLMIQLDAIDKFSFSKVILDTNNLLELKPDINLMIDMLNHKDLLRNENIEIAKKLVLQFSKEFEKVIKFDLAKSVVGKVNYLKDSIIPNSKAINWKKSIRKNIKNYNINQKKLYADKIYFSEQKQKQQVKDIIILVDRSGSMSASFIYASFLASILASLNITNISVIYFDAECLDLSKNIKENPIETIFSVELAQFTYIEGAVLYSSKYIKNPKETLLVLISDLICESQFIVPLVNMKENGVKVVSIIAINEDGEYRFDEKNAKILNNKGIPAFATTPVHLAKMMDIALNQNNLHRYIRDFKFNPRVS